MSRAHLMQTTGRSRKPRRVCLIVPAGSEQKLRKAQALEIDEVVIDFEDALAATVKTDATRSAVVSKLHESWLAPIRAVRVNPVRSQWFRDDVSQLVTGAGHSLDAVVVPKVESAQEIQALAAMLDELEPTGHRVAIEAQIESACALLNVEEIAAASSRLEALVFGPADFAASLGLPHLDIGGFDTAYSGDQWAYARSKIAVAAHAFGIEPIDGPYGRFEDDAGLRVSASRARILGMTGKWAIHPNQLDACIEAFTPSADEIAHAERILAALDEAAEAGVGAAAVGTTMVDEASRRLAFNVLSRAPGHPTVERSTGISPG